MVYVDFQTRSLIVMLANCKALPQLIRAISSRVPAKCCAGLSIQLSEALSMKTLYSWNKIKL